MTGIESRQQGREKNVDVIELIGIHGTNYGHSSMDRVGGFIQSAYLFTCYV